MIVEAPRLVNEVLETSLDDETAGDEFKIGRTHL